MYALGAASEPTVCMPGNSDNGGSRDFGYCTAGDSNEGKYWFTTCDDGAVASACGCSCVDGGTN